MLIATMVDKTSAMVDNDDSLKNIPYDIEALLKEIGKRAQHPDNMKELILRLCQWRAFSISELAKTLGRNEKYLKKNHLQPLLDENKMAYTIPAMLTHPNQKYKTIEKKDKTERM